MKVTKSNLIATYKQYKDKSYKELDEVMDILLSDESYIDDPDFASYVELAASKLQEIVDKEPTGKSNLIEDVIIPMFVKYEDDNHVHITSDDFDKKQLDRHILLAVSFFANNLKIKDRLTKKDYKELESENWHGLNNVLASAGLYDNEAMKYHGINDKRIKDIAKQIADLDKPAKSESKNADELEEVYSKLKEKYNDSLLLFRIGDFYEAIKDDAKTISRVLNITLTTRNNSKSGGYYLCGFPINALDKYITKLVDAGYRIAVVDDPYGNSKPKTTEPAKTKDTKSSVHYDNAINPAINFISRYAKLNGKTFNIKTREEMRKLLSALQKAIVEHKIRKTDEYAKEIMNIQTSLLSYVNARCNNMEIEIKNIEKYKDIAKSNSVIPAITLLKSYLALVGKDGVKEKAKNLIAKIEKLTDKGDYTRQVNSAFSSLSEYVEGKTDVVEANQQTLEGLYGLCGVENVRQERKHSASAAELANTYFNCLHLKGKWEKIIGKPNAPFKLMIYGKPGHGKSTLALQFAGALAEKYGQNVLYVAAEEGLSYTMKEKLERLHIKSPKLYIVDSMPRDVKKYDTIFIDSVNNAGYSAEELRKLPAGHNYVYVMQTTKDGNFRGSQEYLHDVDTCVKVEEMHAHTEKNRFGAIGDAMVLDMDGCYGCDGTEDDGKDNKRFVLNYYYKDGKERSNNKETDSPEGIYMELLSTFGDDSESFAAEMKDWCHQAKKGDHFEDEDVIIDCVK